MKLVLGSTSPFRKMLLEKLHVPFDTAKPDVDETPMPNESAPELVERLSIAKAKAVSATFPNHLIIGSDQVACVKGEILGKPLTHENAVKQLQKLSGLTVTFYTGLCVYDSAKDVYQSLVEPFQVTFRELSDDTIEHYLRIEQPYNCAGSFKSEALGIRLFERLDGRDPNALVGLPLIGLIDLVLALGYDIFEG